MRIASRSCGRSRRCAVAPIETFEALEQLRALWHGYRIVVAIAEGTPAPGVDTPDDLARVRRAARIRKWSVARLTARHPMRRESIFRLRERDRCD